MVSLLWQEKDTEVERISSKRRLDGWMDGSSTIGCKDFWKKMLSGHSNLLSFLCHLFPLFILLLYLIISLLI